MKRSRSVWLVILCLLVITAGISVAKESTSPLEVVERLEMRHPRRGHQLTLVGGKLWVTGGKAYFSHFIGWGKDGHETFNGYPFVEVIDPAAGTVRYTKIDTGKDFYKATAFTVSDESAFIYIAGDGKLIRLDTATQKLAKLADAGVKDDWNEANWGRVIIDGRPYVVLVTAKRLDFFDPATEKFVILGGIDAETPAAEETRGGNAACVIGNKVYVFGGVRPDESGSVKAWVFDPSAPKGEQWSPLADMPVGIDSPKVEVIDGKAYIVGGANAGFLYKTIFAYDPATDTYERRMNLPYEIRNHDTAVIGEDLWVSYGYSWGTEAEGKLGFRMHPPHLVRYTPSTDTGTYAAGARESVKGDKMNLSVTWPDADAIDGLSQTIAINWTAAISSTKGVAYYRLAGEEAYTPVEARAVEYAQGLLEAKGYTAVITELPPSTAIEYYAVSEGDGPVKSQSFHYTTQPAAPETFQVMVYGDSKAQYDVLHELNVDILSKLRAGLEGGLPGWTLLLGDFGAFGAMGEWDAWFNYGWNGRFATREMTGDFAFLPVHGNHECLSPSWFNSFETPTAAVTGWPALGNEGFEERWYSLNYGSLHLAVITTGEYSGEEWYRTQLEWLKADLARAKEAKEAGQIEWVAVAMHHPVFTSGEHFIDKDVAGLNVPGASYEDAIEASGVVDLMLTAHDHDYERTKSITGFRWTRDKDGKPFYARRADATVDENSGRFGSTTQGKGIVWVVLGGAGAGERDMYRLSELGDYSWLAFRKPDIERKETSASHPCFHYGVLTVTPDALKLDVFEKSIAYLPDWNGADDGFTGLLDSLTITK